LITDGGMPALLDFQSSLNVNYIPKFLYNLLKTIDYSGIYKILHKKKPELLDNSKKKKLAAFNKIRPLWFLKGYPLGTKRDRRK
jgi:hypothetical protein